MSFYQTPARIENQWERDTLLRGWLRRVMPVEVWESLVPAFAELSALVAGELSTLAHVHRDDEPTLTSWDAWGHRVDEIRVNAAWKRYAEVAAVHGLVATGYERPLGEHARLAQFTKVYLFAPSSQVYTCPLAMTDGCARTLQLLGSDALRRDVFPRLVSRDPGTAWTSGQWMTERTGGSDVGLSESRARRERDGTWRLFGTKWFTSAITSEVALTLARPEGNGPGGKGLALFFVRLRNADGRLNGITVNRLKEKLGTRNLPTAELTLDGTIAELVSGDRDGIRNMAPMLNLTRTWNAVCSVAGQRRGLALARDYASRRHAFGALLEGKPLHVETLADLACDWEAAFALAFHTVVLLGRAETSEVTAEDRAVLSVLTPLAKLATAKWAVAAASEVLECFGGAGYIEDTGLPVLLRDAQVLPIWEGTTNVLSLEVLRALAREDAWEPVLEEVRRHAAVPSAGLRQLGDVAVRAAEHAIRWARSASDRGRDSLEAGARRFALTLSRASALAFMVHHAEWAATQGDTIRGHAAERFARRGIDWITEDAMPAAAVRAVALEREQALRRGAPRAPEDTRP